MPTTNIKIELKPASDRGFLRGEFRDRNGRDCSIQESSLATEACIWLGINEPKLMYLVLNEGWKEVPLPPGHDIHGRMHLNQEQVAALLPLLQKFVKTGRLE